MVSVLRRALSLSHTHTHTRTHTYPHPYTHTYAHSVWAGGEYRLEISFSEDYPSESPVVSFKPVLWHMNVWASGRVCLNILNPNDGTWHGQWKPSITVKVRCVDTCVCVCVCVSWNTTASFPSFRV